MVSLICYVVGIRSSGTEFSRVDEEFFFFATLFIVCF